ncbi:MAG TPA: SPOR domain-containing protein [Longimicrobiales bacterium]|nr:SPOR domain-containing protein [Longimicrobiales bacterium]
MRRASSRARAHVRTAAWAAAAAAMLLTSPLAAQSPSLDRVEELMRVGRSEEARQTLATWWEDASGDASRQDLQRAMWLRGRLTVDPEQAELDFQRLVVLYPSGTYTPRALLRLAQWAHARGDAAAAERHVATLVRDYPASPARAEAEAWLRAAEPPAAAPPGDEQAARAASPEAPRTAAGNAAPAGAGNAAPAAVDPAAAPGVIRPSAGRGPAPADAPLEWSVQFGAFASEERAFALHRELVDAGLAARLVRVQGSAFYHVRIGRFATREEADRQLQGVTQRGFTAAIVRDDRAEEVVLR